MLGSDHMKSIRSKLRRLRLNAASYEAQRLAILRRDGWQCQFCGAASNLEVHHQVFRSHGGGDSESNLITVCSMCHREQHRDRDSKVTLRES